ncbi:MAG: ATP-dependent Clp protease ATP-binding subunit [bacterium]|nr:ATP-dependent Clp protease ATP-binding subunit [bacterium]
MVICQNCRKRPAVIQTTQNMGGKQVYVALCDVCFNSLQENTQNNTNMIDKFSRDLIKLAEAGKLDPVIGREKEIERVIHILSRRTKNNPVLIGEPGVGKTAIAEGLAQRIASNNVPETLRGKRVIDLDISAVLAGTVHRGAFEQRLKQIIKEIIDASGQIIVFIDELHTIVGAGAAEGAVDAANMLKPALSRGELQMIGATTLDEYKKHIEKDSALERRFQPIIVNEPSVLDTIEILKGLRKAYEDHHKVKITDDAIKAAAELSDRYISDRFLPDKAIDLIDEAGAKVRLAQVKEPSNLKNVEEEIKEVKNKISLESDYTTKQPLETKLIELEKIRIELLDLWAKTKLEEIPSVERKDIASVVAVSTGIPVEELNLEERQKLLALEDNLKTRIVGQSNAIEALSKAIRRARAGLKNPNRPIGTFIFVGPTGVGKTELTKALAEILYGSDDLLVRLDMSEYMEKHTVSKMIGSPPGYVGFDEGGQLTDTVRRKPFSIILLDEIEKAHPDVYNMLLQIMEDGHLTDSKGRKVNFKNTILIMTSNAGSELLKQSHIGFGSLPASITDNSEVETKLKEALEKAFRPEFLNRVDEIIVFNTLSKSEIKAVVGLELKKTQKLMQQQGLELHVTPGAIDYIAEHGFSEDYGARQIRRIIQKEVENLISEGVISQEFKENDQIDVNVKDGKLQIKIGQKTKV